MFLAFFAGTLGTTFVFAHGGDLNLIHACYKTNTGGGLRIVGANDNCAGNETALDWPKTSATGSGNGSPFYCPGNLGSGCPLSLSLLDKLRGKDLTDAYMPYSQGYWNNPNNPADFSGTNFTGAYLENISWAGDYQGAARNNFKNINFTNTDLKSARFSESDFTGDNFTNANLSGIDFGTNTVFGNNIWSNTTCPDGSNSDSNPNCGFY